MKKNELVTREAAAKDRLAALEKARSEEQASLQQLEQARHAVEAPLGKMLENLDHRRAAISAAKRRLVYYKAYANEFLAQLDAMIGTPFEGADPVTIYPAFTHRRNEHIAIEIAARIEAWLAKNEPEVPAIEKQVRDYAKAHDLQDMLQGRI